MSSTAWSCRLLRPALIAATLAAGCGGDYGADFATTAVMNGGDWRDEVIYQLMVDRFADGDPNNNHRVLYSALGRYQGGDWQGIIDHLDYIQDLGVTALWISPVVKNIDFDAGFDGYHGYWTQSLNQINPHFGSPAKLREMVQKAHARGIKVILDIVTNHMGQLFYYDINDNGQPDSIFIGSRSGTTYPNGRGLDELSKLLRYDEYDPDFDYRGIQVQGVNGLGDSGLAKIKYLNLADINRVIPEPIKYGPGDNEVLDFSRPDVFHRFGRTTNYDTWEQLTKADFPGGLKDINTERPDVRAAMINAFARWIRYADFDGFRIDTLKHVDHEFWQVFGEGIRKYVRGEFTEGQAPYYGVPKLTVPKKNWFMFGEAFDGDDSLLGTYTYNNEVDSVFYFSQKFQVFGDVVKCNQGTKKVEQLWNNRLRFDPPNAATQGQYLSDRFRHFPGGDAGAKVDNPASGKPMYNQEPVTRGPVDSTGAGLPPSKLLVNFLDNHDVARFMSPLSGCLPGDQDSEAVRREARRQLHNALGLMLTEDGLPCIYYGTEQEFQGGNDPANRERLFQTVLGNAYLFAANSQREVLQGSGFQTNIESFQWLKKLIKVRKAYAPLRRGDLRVTWSTNNTGSENDAGILAFTRTAADGKAVLVVTNVSPTKQSSTASGASKMVVPFDVGVKLVDVLGDAYNTGLDTSFTVQPGKVVEVTMGSRGTRVLVPEADVKPLM